MKLNEVLKNALKNTKEMIDPLQKIYDQYIMKGDIDSADEVMTKINREKEKYVLAVHLGKDGTPRKINPPQEGGKGPLRFWNTMVPGKNRITGVTYEELIAKLYVYYGGDDPKPQSYTVLDLWEKALEAYKNDIDAGHEEKSVTENQKSFMSLASKMQGLTMADGNLLPSFLGLDIRKLDAELLKTLLYCLAKKEYDAGTPIKKKAFLNFKSALNVLFRYCMKKGIVRENVAEEVTLAKCKGISKLLDNSLKKRAVSDVMHTPEEYQAFFEELLKHADHPKFGGYYVYHFMAMVQNLTGCRPGELCALKEKYDYGTVMRICEMQNSKKQIVGFTKDERGQSLGGRFVPIDSELRRILDEVYALKKQFGIESEFVFCDRAGKPIDKSNYGDVVGNTFRKLGIRRLGTYTFRVDSNNRYAHDVACKMDAIDRGRIIGNSDEVNNQFYTFEEANYLNTARDILERSPKHWQNPEEPSPEKDLDE